MSYQNSHFSSSLSADPPHPSPFESLPMFLQKKRALQSKSQPFEDELLSSIVNSYNHKDWRQISKHVEGKSHTQYVHRGLKTPRPEVKKGPWSPEEDKQLRYWVEKNGPMNWKDCAQSIPGRNAKQCKEHWTNSLNPGVKKGDWTIEEDYLIMLFYKIGHGSWKKILPLFNNRTENSIKNRFFSQLRRVATTHINLKTKSDSVHIKLDTLLIFYNQAIKEIEIKFRTKHKINTDEELLKYIKEKELILIRKYCDYNIDNNLDNNEVLC